MCKMNSIPSTEIEENKLRDHYSHDVKKCVIKCHIPVFLPLLKNSQLHLFSLNGHEPELRYKFRTMLSKIIVTKFSYKC